MFKEQKSYDEDDWGQTKVIEKVDHVIFTSPKERMTKKGLKGLH